MPRVTDLPATLANETLRTEFREYLRTKLDGNKESNPDLKKKFEQWLDFVLICEQVFAVPESEPGEKAKLMVEMCERFLARPPLGYNMALANQLNRRELVIHCEALRDEKTDVPNEALLRPGYEFIYEKLEQKHDNFRRNRPRSPLQAVMCMLS